MRWSPLQGAIFDAIEDPNGGSLAIVARAGSGKTTTLLEGARRVTPRGRMGIVAFARRSKERVIDAGAPSHFEVKTLHAMGLALLRSHNRSLRVDEDGSKLRDILDEECRDVSRGMREAVRRATFAAKTHLLSTVDELRTVLNRDDEVDLTAEEVRYAAELVLRVLFICAERDDLIDFADMVWLPVHLGLGESRYRTLCVDEVQDLTGAQVMLTARVARGGRVFGFGDPAQAIYQFGGADDDALGLLAGETAARSLPLSISYRCPKAVVREAQRIVPDIQSTEDAPDGLVVRGSNLRGVGIGDLVLSRTNAPLLRICLDFVRAGKPAYVAGKAFGEGLVAMLDRSKAATPHEFLRWLAAWEKREASKAEGDEKGIERAADRVACFAALAGDVATMRELRQRIERLFTVPRGGAIVCSTVHQMKGEESDRVFLLADTFRASTSKIEADPAAYAGKEEANLLYVGITRARRALHYVHGVR
jgi:DNA helicase-2/ATP-dependent DNA helicase PcrA